MGAQAVPSGEHILQKNTCIIYNGIWQCSKWTETSKRLSDRKCSIRYVMIGFAARNQRIYINSTYIADIEQIKKHNMLYD